MQTYIYNEITHISWELFNKFFGESYDECSLDLIHELQSNSSDLGKKYNVSLKSYCFKTKKGSLIFKWFINGKIKVIECSFPITEKSYRSLNSTNNHKENLKLFLKSKTNK